VNAARTVASQCEISRAIDAPDGRLAGLSARSEFWRKVTAGICTRCQRAPCAPTRSSVRSASRRRIVFAGDIFGLEFRRALFVGGSLTMQKLVGKRSAVEGLSRSLTRRSRSSSFPNRSVSCFVFRIALGSEQGRAKERVATVSSWKWRNMHRGTLSSANVPPGHCPMTSV